MNTPQNDGGPITASMMTTEGLMDAIGGLSIRDWFAGMALQGQLALPQVQGAMAKKMITSQDLAGACFEYADAMLLARLNQPEALRAGE